MILFLLALALFHVPLVGEERSDYYLTILVAAPRLDYTDVDTLLKSFLCRRRKNGLFGHAWIRLRGRLGAQEIEIEGGHTGELGVVQPKYLDGVMAAIKRGEANPIKYLWVAQRDGYFQKGSGGFRPTFAAGIAITRKQFFDILMFIRHYDYRNFMLLDGQCCSFVTRIARLAGLELESKRVIAVNRWIKLRGRYYRLWDDFFFSSLHIDSPDVLEASLKRAVRNKRADSVSF